MLLENHNNILIVNFTGAGNGFMTTPLLKCLEKTIPDVRYFHTTSRVLESDWFRNCGELKGYQGTVDGEWRRFTQECWDDITSFLQLQEISLVINLRNEGPKYDRNYYIFKEMVVQQKKLPVTFWDMDFESMERRTIQHHLVDDLKNMLRHHGVDMSSYRRDWLSWCVEEKQSSGPSVVGIFLGASQKDKRWPSKKWVSVVLTILESTACDIHLFSGIGPDEGLLAVEVASSTTSDRVQTFFNTSLEQLTGHICACLVFTSNDTGPLHLATAAGIPTVGIFTATDPHVWSYDDPSVLSIASDTLFRCPLWKHVPGNCGHFYEGCPVLAANGDSIKPETVSKAILSLVGKGI